MAISAIIRNFIHCRYHTLALPMSRAGVDVMLVKAKSVSGNIRNTLDWTKANRDINYSNAVIIHGWNENDEGGWLLPTLGTDGKPDDSRTKALEQTLRSSASRPVPSKP